LVATGKRDAWLAGTANNSGRWTRQLAPGSAATRIGNIQEIVRVPGTTTALAAGQAAHASYSPFLALWQVGRNY
jgi:hypothetical protein